MNTTVGLRKGKKQYSVYVFYRHGSKQAKFSTGVSKIEKKQLKGNKIDLLNGIKRNKANEDLIKTLEDQQTAYNAKIRTVKSDIMNIAQRLQLAGIDPVISEVTQEFNKGKKNIRTNRDLKSLIKDFENYSKEHKAPSTYRQIKSGLKIFLDYAEGKISSDGRYSLSLNMFSKSFYDKYTAYLYKEIKKKDKIIKKGMSDNTVGSKIKVLKTFLNYLTDIGYEINPEFKKYKVIKVRKDVVYLTQDELKILINKEFKESHLDRTRNLFVLQCQTGLRISDLLRLDKEHIKKGYIEMKAYKNMKDLYIPITPIAKSILDKYPDGLPFMVEQVYNRQLKDICRLAELERPVETVMTKSGKKIFTTVPLHEKVSSHVAPKTFITHCVEKGISPKAVSEMTGKTVQVLIDHYYGTNRKQIMKEMRQKFGTLRIAK